MGNKKINIDDNVNFTYHYWMRKYFELEGVELTLYALVYNVSCVQDSKLYASAKYIAELIGSSERTVFRAFNSLCEKKLIFKNIEKYTGMERTSYVANIDAIIEKRHQFSNQSNIEQGKHNCHTYCQNDSTPYCQNGTTPTVKMADNNHSIYNQNIYNQDISSSNDNSLNNLTSTNSCKNQEEISICPKKNHSKRFVKPTFEELSEYISENGYDIDPQYFIDYYDSCEWTVGKNKPMKDWKAAVRTWERNNKEWNDNKQHTAHSDNPIDKYGGHNRSIDRTFGPGDEIPF